MSNKRAKDTFEITTLAQSNNGVFTIRYNRSGYQGVVRLQLDEAERKLNFDELEQVLSLKLLEGQPERDRMMRDVEEAFKKADEWHSERDAEGKNRRPANSGAPPALAEALLVLLTDKRRIDGMLGDFEELFHRDRATRNLRHARLLYWSRTLNSIRPLLWPAIKRLFTFVVGVVVGRTSG